MRKDAGYPPLVTPSSQIVGTQAVFNVMMGRYKVLTGEFADLMLGYYGAHDRRRATRHVIELATRQAKKEPIDDPSGRPAEARVGAAARVGTRAQGLQRHRRGRADVRDVPAGRAEVLRHARAGPEEPRQGSRCATSAAPPAAPAADTGTGPVREPITYDVTVNGRAHQVTVSPA